MCPHSKQVSKYDFALFHCRACVQQQVVVVVLDTLQRPLDWHVCETHQGAGPMRVISVEALHRRRHGLSSGLRSFECRACLFGSASVDVTHCKVSF